MEGLSCQSCRGITNEFTILNCDHVVCAECLYGEIKTSLKGTSSIRCACGEVTTFQSTKAPANQAKVTANTSPKCNNSRVLRTESSGVSVRSSRRERRSSLEKFKGGQLNCELQFLGVVFRKSMEEAERNFKKIVDCIKAKFDNLVKNIKLFWLEEMIETKSTPLLELPRLLMHKYKKTVGSKVQRINDALLQQLATYRVDTENESFEKMIAQMQTRESRESQSIGKENKPRHNIIHDERAKLLRDIQQLKDQKLIKKVGRRGQKYKFI